MTAFIYGACGKDIERHRPQIARLRRYLSSDEKYSVTEVDCEGGLVGLIKADDNPRFLRDGEHGVSVVLSGHVYGADDESCGRDAAAVFGCYARHGTEGARHIMGPFAALLVDDRRRRFLAMNDSFGCQPFFWTRRGDTFFFSSLAEAFIHSEIVEPRLDADALAELFTIGFVVGERTLFRDVQRLVPASTFIIEQCGSHTICRNRRFRRGIASMRAKDACRDVDELISAAVRRQLDYVGDGEIRLDLSGGLDSRLVLAHLLRSGSGFRASTIANTSSVPSEDVRYARMLAERFRFAHEVLEEEAGCDSAIDLLLNPCRLKREPNMSGLFGEVLKGKSFMSVADSHESSGLALHRIFTPGFISSLSADPYDTVRRELEDIDNECPIKRMEQFYIDHYSSHFRRAVPAHHRYFSVFLKNRHFPLLDRDVVEYLMDIPSERFRNRKFYFKLFEKLYPDFLAIPSTTLELKLRRKSGEIVEPLSGTERRCLEYLEAFKKFSPLWKMEIFSDAFEARDEMIAACLFDIWHDNYFGHADSIERMRAVEARNRWVPPQGRLCDG